MKLLGHSKYPEALRTTYEKQRVEIPARFLGRGGTFSLVTRDVQVIGEATVEYGYNTLAGERHTYTREVEYGIVSHAGKRYMAIGIKDERWQAVEPEPEPTPQGV